jgi:hypothetical protein
VPHLFEFAASGRARCRGCGEAIAKGELRFGERHPNAFGEGEMTLWFHPWCAAYMRPEPVLEALRGAAGVARGEIEAADALEAAAEFGVAHRRVPRIRGAERAATGRARCRSCRELIEKNAWRIPLVFFEEYRFQPSGYIHAGCAREYFETVDVIGRVRHFNPDLSASDIDALKSALDAPGEGAR